MPAELVATGFSALGLLAAVWWWLVPEAYPLSEPNPMSLVSGAWRPALSWGVGVFGLLGVLAGLGMLAGLGVPHGRTTTTDSAATTDATPAGPAGSKRTGSPVLRGVLVAVAAAQVIGYLGVGADLGVLSLLGYLLAIFGPVVLLVVAGIGAWRHPPTRYVLAVALLAAAAIGTATGMARLDVLTELGRELVHGFADAAPKLIGGTGIFAYGLVWLWALIRYVRRTSGRCVDCGRSGKDTTGEVARWRTWVTVAAALGPLPYALVRMTWLSPWPVMGMDTETLAANPDMRLFGLCLGFAAIGGSILTIGLIRPWGEVFPRWIPMLRGRPVPYRVPTGIGLLVGAAVTVAGKSVALMVLAGTWPWWTLLVFPFPVWGPLLIAASVGYYLTHRGRCRVCGVD